MEDIFKTLPQHTCSWSKDRMTLFKYQEFWNLQELIEGAILAQQTFKAQPSDVLLCSCPKTGTTWLKALSFAIITRQKFNEFTSPLLTTMPHDCVPFLEKDLEKIKENHKNSCFPLVATHLPYTLLPESVITENCKIVYVYRNVKDVVVSNYNFMIELVKLRVEDAPFEEFFDEFYQGVSCYGPYWDHILTYWKASKERGPSRILFLKYEDMKRDTTSEVKKLAEFIGYPFSVEEEKTGVIENIVKMCSFDNLSNLEVNKNGKHRSDDPTISIENRLYFRKAEDGDWKNYFTDEMKDKIDKLMDQKLIETDLVLK
ncbi:flavonol 4'-sulfotransferase-like [Rutidosis leptorrhynchoides]|uniref:flavonol 4'-sulfotransferase-like n=1 Tax=Rutidosis leptorrhynchoides TaxID=125765 RepID=UPI003A9A321B